MTEPSNKDFEISEGGINKNYREDINCKQIQKEKVFCPPTLL